MSINVTDPNDPIHFAINATEKDVIQGVIAALQGAVLAYYTAVIGATAASAGPGGDARAAMKLVSDKALSDAYDVVISKLPAGSPFIRILEHLKANPGVRFPTKP